MNLAELQSREDLGRFLNRNGLLSWGVEIGSLSGGYARELISTWKGQRLDLVDLWASQAMEVYKERQDWTDFEECYRQCQILQSEFPGRIHLVRDYSVRAAKDYPDNQLDFVYIDANHAYEAVAADMEAWYPKVRPGGLFCGHDYWTDTKWPAFGQVKDAVNDWNKKMLLPMHYTPKCGSWWFIKPAS